MAVAVALVATSQASFFTRYADLARRDTTLESSAHKGIPCTTCHVDTRGALVGKAALVGDFYRGLFGRPTEPSFLQFSPPGDDACLGCHREAWSVDASRVAKVPHPAHLRVYAETRDCVGCHRWTAHEETYQARHTSMPFSVVCASYPCHVGTKPASTCVQCHHVLVQGTQDWRETHPKTVAAAGPGACLEFCHKADQCRLCHITGQTPVLPSSIPTASSTAIEQQHVKPNWLSAHGGIALQDPTKCATCHISQGECQDCHSMRPAFHGDPTTWLTRHIPLAADKRRCLTCHQQPFCDACHAQFKQTK